MWQVPLWMIAFFATTYVLGFYLNYRRKDNLRKRNILSILPRLYFWAIYSSFWLFDVTVDVRSTWGRYGILAILIVDSYDEFIELWDSSWKYEFIKWKTKSKKKMEK